MPKPQLASVPPDEPEETPAQQWESAAEVKKENTTWLVPNRIVESALCVLEGHKGVGKSTLCVALAAAIISGKPLLGRRKMPKGDVLWSAAEESVAKDVRPRLEAAGVDMRHVQFPRANDQGMRRRPMLPGSVSYLRSAIEHFGASLLVIDPLSSHVPPDADLRADQAIHQILDPVAELAHTTGCTIIITRNLVKDSSKERLHAGLGGAAVAGVARSVLVIDWPDRKLPRRLLRVVACNQATPNTPALEYSLVSKGTSAVITPLKEVPTMNDDDDATIDPSERDVRQDARTLLRKLIGSAWVSVLTIKTEAEAASVSERTLRTAKAELGVRSRRISNTSPAYWEWGPPKQGW